MTTQPTTGTGLRSILKTGAIALGLTLAATTVVAAAIRFDEHKPIDVTIVSSDQRCLPPGVRGRVVSIVKARHVNPFTDASEVYVTVATADEHRYDCARPLPTPYHVGERVVGAI